MDFTEITRKTGSIIAKIKNNNKLIAELNKQFNPTFVEIIESLQKTDKTLAQLLMVWYMNTYSVNEDDLNNIVDKYKDKTIKKSSKCYWGGCGSSDYMDDSGCGSSPSSRGGC